MPPNVRSNGNNWMRVSLFLAGVIVAGTAAFVTGRVSRADVRQMLSDHTASPHPLAVSREELDLIKAQIANTSDRVDAIYEHLLNAPPGD